MAPIHVQNPHESIIISEKCAYRIYQVLCHTLLMRWTMYVLEFIRDVSRGSCPPVALIFSSCLGTCFGKLTMSLLECPS